MGVTHIENKLRENRLKWYGHVQRRAVDAPVRKSDRIVVLGDVRGRSRPRLTWESVGKHDMNKYNLIEHIALDRVEWRKRICTADPI